MHPFRDQRETLKSAATAMKRAEIPFALAGGYAAWARGGPESTHDVDFVVTPDAMEAALAALVDEGHDLVEAPEDWLAKVRRNGVLHGEPVEIWPFLGNYLLGEVVDDVGADLAVHGHAHAGNEKGLTADGRPVRNVAQPVIRAAYRIYEVFPGGTR